MVHLNSWNLDISVFIVWIRTTSAIKTHIKCYKAAEKVLQLFWSSKRRIILSELVMILYTLIVVQLNSLDFWNGVFMIWIRTISTIKTHVKDSKAVAKSLQLFRYSKERTLSSVHWWWPHIFRTKTAVWFFQQFF